MSASSRSSLGCVDIIDLDRYMRSGVRPPGPRAAREQLVVDAGGAGRGAGGERDKRYWHDSGLSDSSYVRRRRRPLRRSGDGRARLRTRPSASQASAHQFRSACERALRDQQQQIARMAALCQMLVQPGAAGPGAELPPTTNPPTQPQAYCVQNMYEIAKQFPSPTTNADGSSIRRNVTTKNFGQNVSCVPRRQRDSDSSDVTSSSRSAADERRGDGRRAESCKTYNIIMSKLDELNRLFVARRAASPAARSPRGSAHGSTRSLAAPDRRAASEVPPHTVRVARARRGGGRCAVARVHELDIAPRSVRRSAGDAASGSSRASGARCHRSDQQQPYAQAKGLPALPARPAPSRPPERAEPRGEPSAEPRAEPSAEPRGLLCALCRGYWRALRRRVAQQLWGGAAGFTNK